MALVVCAVKVVHAKGLSPGVHGGSAFVAESNHGHGFRPGTCRWYRSNQTNFRLLDGIQSNKTVKDAKVVYIILLGW